MQRSRLIRAVPILKSRFVSGADTGLPGGTGLTAFIAELITLPGRGNQTGGEESLRASFQERWLETPGQADPDTAPAADATVGEFIFRERARGTYQPGVNTGSPPI